MKHEIFDVKATRCIRCGGILLSEYGLKHGMGQVCRKKYCLEHAPVDENQITFFDEKQEENDNGKSIGNN
jgi:hypothetical protein